MKQRSIYCSSASPVTRHASRLYFSFKGKWLVRYDSEEFSYPEILPRLLDLQNNLTKANIAFQQLYVRFARSADENLYRRRGETVFMLSNGRESKAREAAAWDWPETAVLPLAKPIRSIGLYFPRLIGDPRWTSMSLPAAQLILAANLQARHFQVNLQPLDLPAEPLPAAGGAADMLGFTLFEDLFLPIRDYLSLLKPLYNGILAAGGPMLTLAPIAAIYHLPQFNLFVRGEAEEALPEILRALNAGDIETLSKQSGFFWQQPGLIVISDFNRINRPETFRGFQVNFDFLRPEHMEHGLEMNFSRGCRRGCTFCCRVQGSKLRRLPLNRAGEFLEKYQQKIAEFSLADHQVRTVNINDDDILQDPEYAAAVFSLLKQNDFRIYGIQTALASLFEAGDRVAARVLDLVADPDLYADRRPLLWLGTDVFLSIRARRLGKRLPTEAGFLKLLTELEKRHIRHFHYWISSDHESIWQELVDEFTLICQLFRDFANFGLLAHAPFLIPYPTSTLFQRLPRAVAAAQIKNKIVLPADRPDFRYPLVERLETRFANLNRLLQNEKAGGTGGFFDFLKANDFKAAAQIAYHFLKQERLMAGDLDRRVINGLDAAEKKLEKSLIEITGARRFP